MVHPQLCGGALIIGGLCVCVAASIREDRAERSGRLLSAAQQCARSDDEADDGAGRQEQGAPQSESLSPTPSPPYTQMDGRDV